MARKAATVTTPTSIRATSEVRSHRSQRGFGQRSVNPQHGFAQLSVNPQRGSARLTVNPQRGFTLLEIALVLMIIGIVLGFAIPRLPSFGRTDLEASADRLASTMTYLADEASLRGRIYRLTLDLDAGRWEVAALAPFATPDGESRPEFHEDRDDPLARSVELPRDVFLDAVVDRDGETSSGRRQVFFLPEGVTESLRVRLREDEDDAESTVVLDAALGAAHREATVEGAR